MLNKRKLNIILICIMMIVVLAGCNNVRIMWRSHNSMKHTQAKYAYFTGSKEKAFRVEAGQTLDITYETEVKRGELTVRLVDPSGEELLTFEPNTSGVKTQQIGKTGRYTLQIIGDATKGGYDIRWKIK